VEHYQFQQVDVQPSREDLLVGRRGNRAGQGQGAQRLRSLKSNSQLPISSKKPITPALQGKHREQQNQLGMPMVD